MEGVNLAMMGLRGLILLIIQKSQRNPKMESARHVLGRYLSQRLSKCSINSSGVIELVNAVVSIAEEKGVETDMLKTAQEMILDSNHDLDFLLRTFLEREVSNTSSKELHSGSKIAV
jgi:hypothetical protein